MRVILGANSRVAVKSQSARVHKKRVDNDFIINENTEG